MPSLIQLVAPAAPERRRRAVVPRAWLLLAVLLALGGAGRVRAAGLRIGYSDWPGWVAWQVAIDKGWLTQAGLDVQFQWFDYSASMDAFSAGQLDADLVTNGDALVLNASGTRNIMVMVTDYSNGNDMIIGAPGVSSLADLRGRKVGIEVGLVEHLLLLDGLHQAGVSIEQVSLVNAKTNETPQVLASGQVAAVGAWQPNAGEALRVVPGAHPLFTSAQAPGLIYDVLAVSPQSLALHQQDYRGLVAVWDRVVHYIDDPATQADAVRIMATRVGLAAAQYRTLLAGTHLIDSTEARRVLQMGTGLDSLYGSSSNADAFNVRYGVYHQPQRIVGDIDPALEGAHP
jgi:NitT/TauT family transport system substrate-binding protein